MRVFIVLGMLALVSLSGCASGGGGLAAFVVQPGDLPTDCSYIPSEELRKEAADANVNITGNPGSADNDAWGDDNVTANYFAFYDCADEGEVFSHALQFQTQEQASMYAADAAEWLCSWDDQDGAVLISGAIVAQFNVDGEALSNEVGNITAAIKLRTGAVDICDAFGEDN